MEVILRRVLSAVLVLLLGAGAAEAQRVRWTALHTTTPILVAVDLQDAYDEGAADGEIQLEAGGSFGVKDSAGELVFQVDEATSSIVLGDGAGDFTVSVPGSTSPLYLDLGSHFIVQIPSGRSAQFDVNGSVMTWNGATLELDGNVVPGADNAYTLGSSGVEFATGWVQRLEDSDGTLTMGSLLLLEDGATLAASQRIAAGTGISYSVNSDTNDGFGGNGTYVYMAVNGLTPIRSDGSATEITDSLKVSEQAGYSAPDLSWISSASDAVNHGFSAQFSTPDGGSPTSFGLVKPTGWNSHSVWRFSGAANPSEGTSAFGQSVSSLYITTAGPSIPDSAAYGFGGDDGRTGAAYVGESGFHFLTIESYSEGDVRDALRLMGPADPDTGASVEMLRVSSSGVDTDSGYMVDGDRGGLFFPVIPSVAIGDWFAVGDTTPQTISLLDEGVPLDAIAALVRPNISSGSINYIHCRQTGSSEGNGIATRKDAMNAVTPNRRGFQMILPLAAGEVDCWNGQSGSSATTWTAHLEGYWK